MKNNFFRSTFYKILSRFDPKFAFVAHYDVSTLRFKINPVEIKFTILVFKRIPKELLISIILKESILYSYESSNKTKEAKSTKSYG